MPDAINLLNHDWGKVTTTSTSFFGTMAEAIATIGAVAAIAQLIDYGVKLITRLNEFSSILGSEYPDSFRDIRDRLSLVLKLLGCIQQQQQQQATQQRDHEVQYEFNTVQPLIESTSKDVVEVLELVEKNVKLAQGGSRLKKGIGAIGSLSSDKRVKKLDERLQSDIRTLSFYQSVTAFDLTQKIALQLLSLTAFTQSIGQAQPRSQIEDVHILDRAGEEDLDQNSRPVESSRGGHSPEKIEESVQNGMLISLRQDMSFTSPANDAAPFDAYSNEEDITANATMSHQPGTCSRSCSCICHRTSQFRAPSFLTTALGYLVFTSRGTSFISKTCTKRMCKRQAQFSASMSYRFPPWLVARAIFLSFSSSPRNMISSLTTMRVLPGSARVFAVISSGAIEELRSMFQKRQASIYDIDEQNWTLLHVRWVLY